MRWLKWMLWGMMLGMLAGCGYNELQRLDEEVKAKWSEVVNQYQRRADLVPNLVETVKGYAGHEAQVLEALTQARARVGQVSVSSELLEDAQAMRQFQQAQGELSGVLSRLLVVAENYPELKANVSFENLMAQLDGTENRIAVARNRYIEAVRDYNVKVRSFPSNLTAKLFGLQEKVNFQVENESALATSPSVQF
ncbi:LemA family protein [Rappaport israeli]|uniref:LemA family protein n=1 Tax=Rappaport israeli TaxID=1839807 RepID=UPI0009303BEF|nr:LemA family protein [Rappaport israeli]